MENDSQDNLAAFQAIIKELGDDFTLIGDCLIVEALPLREAKLSKSIVFASSQTKQVTGMESNPPIFVRVLAAGIGYYNEETGQSIDLDVKPGNVLEVAASAVRWFSQFGSLQVRGVDSTRYLSGIGIMREVDHHIKFEKHETYDKFMGSFEIK